jgi:hypothetical protein
MQAKHRTHLLGTAHVELSQTTLLLDPAKHLLNASAGIDRLGVDLVASCTTIVGRTTRMAGVPCQGVTPIRWSSATIPFVVVLASTQGFLMSTGKLSDHRLGCIPSTQCRQLG